MRLTNREYWIIKFRPISQEFQILHQPESIDRGSGLQYEDKELCIGISTSSFPDIEYRSNNYLHFYVQGEDRRRDDMWIHYHMKDFGRLFKAMQNLGPIKTEDGRIRLDV